MSPRNSSIAVVVDASVVVAIAAKETAKYAIADAEIQHYLTEGSPLFAPQLVVMESLYALCRQLQDGVITSSEHASALANLHTFLMMLEPSPLSDSYLLLRAEQLRAGYGCSRSADGMYIALAEHLARSGTTELLTFDAGQEKQASAASSVKVRVLDI